MHETSENRLPKQDPQVTHGMPQSDDQRLDAVGDDFCDAFLPDDEPEPLPDASDFWFEKDLDQD